MKHQIHYLYHLFRPDKSGLIIILLLLFSTSIVAQDSPPEEFPIGSTIGDRSNRTNQTIYNSYLEIGLNTIEQYAADSTRTFLEDYKLCAMNMDRQQDFIYHYSSAYYSKWEAEEDKDTPYVGVKHKYGELAQLGDTLCWSTKGILQPIDSLVYGPHYHQEKWYRRWLYTDTINMRSIYDVRYIPRYKMALTNPYSVPDTQDVCRLYVMIRHARFINGVWDTLVHNDTLKVPITLKVSDFLPYGQFKYFYFSNTPSERWYRYPEAYQIPGDYYKLQYPDKPDTVWEDIYGNNGVEFRVEWLRSDTLCTLYIDNIEVYDNYGWSRFIDEPVSTANDIKNYALNFKNASWSNIKYWIGCDEPFTIDSYIPIRTVDSLLRDISAPPLLVHVYPYWNIEINEDSQLVRYYKTAKPDPLNIHFFPFNSWNVPSSYGDWEAFRKQLQISYSLTGDKGFWYKAQNFGYQLADNSWLGYRKPNPAEQKAEVMLALAHGVKGLVFSHYDSFTGHDDATDQDYTLRGLVGLPPGYVKDTLWYVVRDEIVPRLKGTLGNTLLDLDYTGNFIRIVKEPIQPDGDFPPTYGYLSLSCTQPFYHFHAGFFHRKNLIDDTYFMLVNIKGTSPVRITIMNNFGCSNLRIKYVENPAILDTTITGQFIKDIPMPPGEGYLFEVAPVVKYGGKLIYNETISITTTLHDEMVIQNSAILTVNSTYNVYADIRIKAGGRIVTTGNGKINFYQGHKLIIEGNAILNGTVSNKLKLDFTNPINSNGIIIKPGGSLTMSYWESRMQLRE